MFRVKTKKQKKGSRSLESCGKREEILGWKTGPVCSTTLPWWKTWRLDLTDKSINSVSRGYYYQKRGYHTRGFFVPQQVRSGKREQLSWYTIILVLLIVLLVSSLWTLNFSIWVWDFEKGWGFYVPSIWLSHFWSWISWSWCQTSGFIISTSAPSASQDFMAVMTTMRLA